MPWVDVPARGKIGVGPMTLPELQQRWFFLHNGAGAELDKLGWRRCLRTKVQLAQTAWPRHAECCSAEQT